MDRADVIHEAFLRRVETEDLPKGSAFSPGLSPEKAVAIFRAQCQSRNLDRASRRMQKAGQAFYTIGSSGHEGMAAVAQALRPDDMAFLHYRDGAFLTGRAGMVPGETVIHDMALSFASSIEDPISGGRHKVLGSKSLMIPPQTSTIASHLPKAVGAAYSVGLARRHAPEHRVLAEDGLVMASFGDASSNHSTAQGAINAACWTAYQSMPLPLLFVCEDNGIGISVRTPKGWVAANFAERPGLKYFHADGLNFSQVYAAASNASQYARKQNKPAFLHLSLVRLYGHAGSDVQDAYLPRTTYEAWEAEDPLLHSVRLLNEANILDPQQALEIYQETAQQVTRVTDVAVTRPRLSNASEVMASIIPPSRPCAPSNGPSAAVREAAFGSDARQMDKPQHMSKLINWALTDLMLEYPEIAVMGEDVGAKGGVYGVTQRLINRFGPDRVIDTLLDEQSILGLAIGLAHNGFIPIPEIQFLAYLHNAEDQIRGEAATLSFFSNGQFTNPMVLRIAGLGYQRGFGGHFHNDNSLAVLRDIPGVIVAVPSDGDEAVLMLRECVRLAREEGRVVIFVEPIALYPMRDLHQEKDGGWLRHYPKQGAIAQFGTVAQHGDGKDLTLLSYGNGVYLSHQARNILAQQGINTRVVDIRWLAPLPETAILDAIAGPVLIVDECRRSGGPSEALMTLLKDHKASRYAAEDSFIATGPSYAATLPSRDGIVAAAKALLS